MMVKLQTGNTRDEVLEHEGNPLVRLGDGTGYELCIKRTVCLYARTIASSPDGADAASTEAVRLLDEAERKITEALK